MILFNEKLKFIIILTIAIIILAPLYILGKIFLIIGKFISTLCFIFWLEPSKFISEIKKIFTNNNYNYYNK